MMRRKAGDVRIRVRFFALLAGALAAGCSSTQTNEPSDPSWRDAEAAYLAGDWPSAISAYDRFIQAHPDDSRVPTAQLQIGRAYFANGRAAGALPFLDRVIGSGAEAVTKGEAHAARGLANLSMGNLDRAKEDFLDAIRLGDGEIHKDEVLFHLGLANIRRGDWEEGLSDMMAVIKEAPESGYAAKARAIRASGDREFHVQAGAFSDPAGARRRADELRTKGYATEVVPDGSLSCVRYGKYATWKQATEAARALQDATGVETTAIP